MVKICLIFIPVPQAGKPVQKPHLACFPYCRRIATVCPVFLGVIKYKLKSNQYGMRL